MNAFLVLVVSCWAILLLFWSVSAFFTKRETEREGWSRLTWGLLFMLSYLLLVEGYGIMKPNVLQHQVLSHSFPMAALGLALTVAGTALAIWARVILGGNWSAAVSLKRDHELVRRGPYAVVRHPIYSGLLLMYLGTAIAIGNLGGLIGFPILLASCWIKLWQEEAMLLQHFKEYPGYSRRVKALIPRVL